MKASRINGPNVLRDGDVVRIGRTSLVFHGAAGGRAAAHDAGDRPRRAGHHGFPAQGARRALPARAGHGLGAASNREIAGALFVSVETVKTHMRALFDAFAVGDVPQYHKRTELVRERSRRASSTVHDLDRDAARI